MVEIPYHLLYVGGAIYVLRTFLRCKRASSSSSPPPPPKPKPSLLHLALIIKAPLVSLPRVSPQFFVPLLVPQLASSSDVGEATPRRRDARRRPRATHWLEREGRS